MKEWFICELGIASSNSKLIENTQDMFSEILPGKMIPKSIQSNLHHLSWIYQ